jgi:predicted RND superfamily exporter protein
LRQEIVENLKLQQLTFVPATGLAYLLILLVMFRRPAGVILPLAVVAITMVVVTAMLVRTGSPVNIINNILPSLVFIIGVSDSIHMLVRDSEEIEQGATRIDAIKAMIRHTGMACLLTSATTAVGFFSLLAAQTQILKDFGWQAGAAVVLAYAATLFFLPAALSYFKPVKRKAVDVAAEEPWIERSMTRLGEKAITHPKAFLAFGLVLTLVALVAAVRVKIDTVLLEVYEPGHPTYDTLKMTETKLGGILPIEVSLDSDQPNAFKNPENYRKLAELQAYAGTFDVVLSTQSLVDFHQAARAALLDDPNQRQTMPTSQEEIEQIQVLVAGPPDSSVGANKYMSTDFSHARLLLRVADDGARAQLKLGQDLKEKLKVLFPEESGVKWTLTGDAYVASISLDSFIRDLFGSLMLAMVIIFGMMSLAFGSLRLGLISVIPNATPLIFTLGYMGVKGTDLNTTTIITFAIGLGLAVDDTIHFLARYQEEREAGADAGQAVVRAYNGAGRAIMLTSVMLLIGLGILLMSDFVPTRMFGTLTGITIVGAIIGDLIILPPLLYLIDSYRDRRMKTTS